MGILRRNSLRVAVGLCVIGLGAFIVAPTGATAATMTLESTVHGFVRDFGPLDQIGDYRHRSYVSVGNYELCAVCGGYEDRAMIEFDLSSLTHPVTSAILRLTRTASDLTASRTFEVFGYIGDGNLNVADFATAASGGFQSLGSFDYFNEPLVDFVGSGIVNLTSFIAALAASQSAGDYAGLQIRWGPTVDQRYATFGQANMAGTFPIIEVVTSMPIPAALPLFASAIIGFLVVGYRRRANSVAA